MKIALWIIAICEVVRLAQNAMQLRMVKGDTSARDNAYAEFIKSLKMTDREFVHRMLKEFEDGAEMRGDNAERRWNE